jgi:hypothetical protein
MRGTRVQAVTLGCLLTGCSFDPGALGGGGGGGDSGPAARSDGAPASPDAAVRDPDGAPPDGAVDTVSSISCNRTEVPPALDGAPMGPWTTASFIHFASQDGQLVTDVHPNYGFDAEVSLACLHDDENLYFFADVIDSAVVTNSLSLREDDGIVIFLDGAGDRDGSYDEDDHALMLGAGDETWDYGPGDISPAGTVVAEGGGYRIEIAIDKVAISGALGSHLGFNLALIDDDGMGNSDRDLFSLRYVPHPPACPSCCDGQAQPWCDTSQLGGLELLD